MNHKHFSRKRIIMCGKRNSKVEKVDKSILTTSCSNAMKKCSSARSWIIDMPRCIKDYVEDAFDDGRYKFCDSSYMNIMITPHHWGSYANGLEYVNGVAANEKSYACIAYCIDGVKI